MSDHKEESNETGSFVEGDLFSGIIIADYVDRDYRFEKDGNHITVSQRVSRPKEDRLCLGFLFLMERPERFRLEVLIPETCYNANCSLNGKELLGYFSKELPHDPEDVVRSQCGSEDGHEKFTTLKPGSFQSLNFRWESGDIVKFFFYFR
jgi:hypothetical protein